MTLPNSDRATVDPRKVRDYLLSEAHPVGRFKSSFFISFGYTDDQWELLRDDLLTLARTGQAVPGKPSAFGRMFEVNGILKAPSGRSVELKTIWMIRENEDAPHFVTAYPR